jgi:hypothetical protein
LKLFGLGDFEVIQGCTPPPSPPSAPDPDS